MRVDFDHACNDEVYDQMDADGSSCRRIFCTFTASCVKLRQNGRKGAQTGGNGLEMNAGKEVLADGEVKIVQCGARYGRRPVLVPGATVCEHIVKRE